MLLSFFSIIYNILYPYIQDLEGYELQFNLKQLEAFVCVVESNSFSKASEKLFLSQSTISCHIAQLEQALQASLLDRRNKRAVMPTESGLRLYRLAKEVLNQCGEIQDSFLSAESEPKLITISASTVPSRYILPRLITSFTALNKKSRFSVLDGDSMFALKKLRTGEAALAFVGTRINNSRSFCFHALCRDRIVLITPNTHEFQKHRARGAFGRELLQYPIILREEGSGTRKEVSRYLSDKGILEQDLFVVARINDFESIKSSVANGLGVTLISERAAADYVQEKRVLQFQLDETDFSRELYLAYLKTGFMSTEVRGFLRFCLQTIDMTGPLQVP